MTTVEAQTVADLHVSDDAHGDTGQQRGTGGVLPDGRSAAACGGLNRTSTRAGDISDGGGPARTPQPAPPVPAGAGQPITRDVPRRRQPAFRGTGWPYQQSDHPAGRPDASPPATRMSGPPPLPAALDTAGDPDWLGVPARLPAAHGTESDAPLGATPAAVRAWFDAALDSAIPDADGTLATAQQTARILARHAKADNTRRAYRAGVRAWCAWCGRHGLTPLPAQPADIAAFLAAERYRPEGEKRLAANTLRLRVAAIAYLHYLAGCPSPTSTAVVTETFAGLDRLAKHAGQGPRPKLAAKIGILREILAPIGDDLPGLRDRALLLLGFAGAFRRAELARIAVGDLEAAEHGLRITLPFSKGDRESKGVQVGIPYGVSELCPVRALQRWRDAAAITTGPLFRRIWATPRPKSAPSDWQPIHVVGHAAVDPGTIARIVKARGKAAGFDATALGGHSLKRGAMNTAKDRRVHPAQLKQLGRHRSYATLATYIEEGDLFEDNALNGVL